MMKYGTEDKNKVREDWLPRPFHSWMTMAACMWLGQFPLLQFGSYSTITKDKWWIMLLLMGMTVGCFFMDLMAHKTRKPTRAPLIVAGLLYFCIVISCLMSGEDSSVWWTGSFARFEGLLTQLCYFLLFILFSYAEVERKALVFWTSVGVLLFGSVVILQRLGQNPFHLYPMGTSIMTNPEFQGTIGNIDMCTGYLVLIFGFLCTDFLQILLLPQKRGGNDNIQNKTNPVAILLTLAALVTILYLIISMGVQFGIVALGGYVLYLLLTRIHRRFRLFVFLLVMMLALMIAWFYPYDEGGLWELHEIMRGRPQLSFGSNRIGAWFYSLKLGQTKWLWGGGSGTFMKRFSSYLIVNGFTIPSSQGNIPIPTTFDSPHNEYIAMFVNHGLPAAIFFLALIIWFVMPPLLKKDRFLQIGNQDHIYIEKSQDQYIMWMNLAAAIVNYGIQMFFSFSVCIVSPLFWIIMGIAASRK